MTSTFRESVALADMIHRATSTAPGGHWEATRLPGAGYVTYQWVFDPPPDPAPPKTGDRMLISPLPVGSRWKIDHTTARMTMGEPVRFHPSVTLVEVTGGAPSHPQDVTVVALDGHAESRIGFPDRLGKGARQIVGVHCLTRPDPTREAPAVTVGSRWRIDPLMIRNVGGGPVYFHPSVTTVEVVALDYHGTPGRTYVRAVDGANPLNDKRDGALLYAKGNGQCVDAKYLTVPADSTTDTPKETPVTAYPLSPAALLRQLQEHRTELARAHERIITEHLDRVVTEEDHRVKLAAYFREMALLVESGEVELDDDGSVLGWTDRNREDELPEQPVMDPYAQGAADSAKEAKVAALEAQDRHIDFVSAMGGDVVMVERSVYESWFVKLP